MSKRQLVTAALSCVLLCIALVGCNVVVDALTRYADPDQPHVAGVVAGDAMATWIPAGMVPFGGAGSGVHVSPDGAEGLLLTGDVGYVLDAGACDVLLVSALNQAGELVHVLVDASAPGVTVRELSGLDLTRQACAVGFDAVRRISAPSSAPRSPVR